MRRIYTTFMDLAQLRADILTALGELVGTYTFSNGATTAAIRKDDGSIPYEEEPDVEGLEVVIVPFNRMNLTPMLGGDKRLDSSVQIVLKQWDINETTQAAREILISQLPIDRVEPLVPRSDKLDNLEVSTLAMDDDVYFFG